MPASLTLSDEATTKLLTSTQQNVARVYNDPAATDCDRASIDELLAARAWTELDDRFFRDIAFGTGGMRGRTIGKIVTKAEAGKPQPLDRPEFPGAGTNMLNFGNVHRAVSALGAYLIEGYPGEKLSVVIAHDTRYFSPEFARAAAKSLNALGIDALLFPEDRSTPQLSFTTRVAGAHAGIMITASHNPPHDNGMKFYSRDGGQVVEPHASGITKHFAQLSSDPAALPALLKTVAKPGRVVVLDPEMDVIYRDAVAGLVLEPAAILETRDKIKFVYTPLHGTGIRAVPALLDQFGFRYSIVGAQSAGDGRFPTVKSPNPENAEALELAIRQAEAERADVVMATDPDADRMGVAVRDADGKMVLLTGNQIGSIMAHYRCERLVAQGILTDNNRANAVIIKTFVTTDLQKRIAERFGLGCIETLTGFKYIGEKMHDYEKAHDDPQFAIKAAGEQRAASLAKSKFVIFAGEESYGYTGGDYVRDKDANAAVLMFAEVAAWAKSKGRTLAEYLDAIYRELGFYTEKLGTLTFEGAQGAQQIARLLASFRAQPPARYQGQAVTGVDDFGLQDFADADGKKIPKETMLLFHLADGGRMVVRGSGTEPKIKFYFLTRADVGNESDLAAIKAQRKAFLESWWNEVQEDVKKRVA
ncbi:MAG TPA: phospho-sugar mutase [Candidatus Methylacidiphilales bacterium]|jgi:phosphoglucomutase|nr:phospho-sugar mutase [Candidatus Methylacidiphilales bacterium]